MLKIQHFIKMISSITPISQNKFTNKNNLSVYHFFQKLDESSELIKELDLEKDPTSTYAALYASMMLIGDFNDTIYDWITQQLTIDDHWNEQWTKGNQSKFEQVFQLLNFDHKFALLVGAYRLAKLGERNTNHASTQNHHEAAEVLKGYLIKLIQDNPLAYRQLDLNDLSIKNSQALKFNQSTLPQDFLKEISKQIQPQELDKNLVKFSMSVKAIFTTFGLAAGGYFYRYLSAKPTPPPPKSLIEASYEMVKNNVSLFLGTTTLISLVFFHQFYCMKKERLEDKKAGLEGDNSEQIKKQMPAKLDNKKVSNRKKNSRILRRIEAKRTESLAQRKHDRKKFSEEYSNCLSLAIKKLIDVDVKKIEEKYIIPLSRYISEIISLNYEIKFNELISISLYKINRLLQETDHYKKFKKAQKANKDLTPAIDEDAKEIDLKILIERIKELEIHLPKEYKFFTPPPTSFGDF